MVMMKEFVVFLVTAPCSVVAGWYSP